MNGESTWKEKYEDAIDRIRILEAENETWREVHRRQLIRAEKAEAKLAAAKASGTPCPDCGAEMVKVGPPEILGCPECGCPHPFDRPPVKED